MSKNKKTPELNRRNFLATTGSTLTATIAGCQDQNNTNTNNTTAGNGDDSLGNGNGNGNGNDNGNGEPQPPTGDMRVDLRNTSEVQQDNPVYGNYNTPHGSDTFLHDLEQSQNRHREIYEILREEDTQETLKEYQDTITDDSAYTDVKDGGRTGYHEIGLDSFDEETWIDADPHLAISMAHRYLLSLENEIRGSVDSGRRADYATALTHTMNDEHPEHNIHAWDILIDGGSHGNGLIYSESTDSLHVLETVPGYPEQIDHDEQFCHLTAKVENSEFFREDGSENRGLHHPLRFHDEHTREHGVTRFEDAKRFALGALTQMNYPSVGGNNTRLIDREETTPTAVTTGYLEDAIEELRFYNERNNNNNNIDFEDIRAQGAVIMDLAMHEDNFVMGGSVENPWAIKVDDNELIDEIQVDDEGEYDNLIDEIEEYEDAIDLSNENYDNAEEILEESYQIEALDNTEALNTST